MQVTKTVEETRKQIKQWKKEGKTIGLVPTMGFLHEGHASLIRKCREQNDIVVVSDFVNPTQFGPNEDLEAYPRDFERDSKLCESLGADLIFAPSPEDMTIRQDHFHDITATFTGRCGFDITATQKRMRMAMAAADHISVNRWSGSNEVEFSLIFGFSETEE